MNKQNYGTREACQRLVDAGIVVETDLRWCKNQTGTGKKWFLANHKMLLVPTVTITIPAPSMAEVWRELPREFQGGDFEVGKTVGGQCFAGYCIPADYIDDFGTEIITFKNTNPTDALIDLLIWVREQKGKEV